MGFITLFLLVLLSACEAAATPVGQVTATIEETSVAIVTVTQTPLPALRYGFIGGAEQYAPEDAFFASVEAIPPGSDSGVYDIAAAYGTLSEWQQSPISQHVTLVLNPNLSPLAQENIATLVRSALSPRDLLAGLEIPGVLPGNDQFRDALAVRVELANLGYPDGLTLTLAAENLPGLELVTNQLAESSIQTRLVAIAPEEAVLTFNESRAHLLLLRWYDDPQRAQWVERAGAENVIDLYTLPISYQAKDDLAIELSAEGWPIPASR